MWKMKMVNLCLPNRLAAGGDCDQKLYDGYWRSTHFSDTDPGDGTYVNHDGDWAVSSIKASLFKAFIWSSGFILQNRLTTEPVIRVPKFRKTLTQHASLSDHPVSIFLSPSFADRSCDLLPYALLSGPSTLSRHEKGR